ncbi:MAG TPA: hypothetical protein VN226_07910 [Anaerolineales bacterium]|nr:hypothetical protein [Anaerolineales bacterium]
MTTIYGIDLHQPITPLMVKNALTQCFFEAHCQDTEFTDTQNSDINHSYCAKIVQKAFIDTNGDINAPTKQDIINVIEYLSKFSKSFRDPQIIAKHAAQIQQLIDNLP